MASSNPKDLVKKLTAVKKVESTDDENIQEIQRSNKIRIHRLRLVILAIVVCFAATLIGIFVVGFGVQGSSSKTEMIDKEDKRFAAEVGAFNNDELINTNASINKWKSGGELQAILDTTKSDLNSSTEYAKEASKVVSMEKNISNYINDLDLLDYADTNLKIANYYPDYRASFYGTGCPTKDNCPISAVGNWSIVSKFDDCLKNCHGSKDGKYTAYSGVTYQPTTQGCWCTDQAQVSSTFKTLAGYLYFRFF